MQHKLISNVDKIIYISHINYYRFFVFITKYLRADLPSVLSGDKLGMIDPHQHFFAASSHGWNISKSKDLLRTIRNQLDPYIGLFDCTEATFRQGYYNGTMFRFPLRNSPSSLSGSLYTPDRVKALFESFRNDSHLTMIFLRNLEKIEIYERDRLASTPKLCCCVKIHGSCIEEVRQKRKEFLEKTRTGSWLDRPIANSYVISVESTTYPEVRGPPTSVVDRFLVTNYYCGGSMSAVFRNLHQDTELNYLPCVGTAMPLNLKMSDQEFYSLTDGDGHVFCFLPLPLEQNSSTGLPVHINGFFALEQNRKYIKWPGSYKSRSDLMDKRLLWNQCLLKEALPKAYASMILEAIRMNSSSVGDQIVSIAAVYRAFPDFSKVDRKWECMLPILFAELFKYPVVFTGAEGGQWIEARQAVFNTIAADDEATKVVLDILTNGRVKVVDVPDHVLQAIKKCCRINLNVINAAIVAGAYREVQSELSLPWEDKMKLLRYLLLQPKYELLDGLALLPLANGGFNVFHYNPKKADRPIYISTSAELCRLLPGLDDDLLEMDIDKDIKKMLIKAASKGKHKLCSNSDP